MSVNLLIITIILLCAYNYLISIFGVITFSIEVNRTWMIFGFGFVLYFIVENRFISLGDYEGIIKIMFMFLFMSQVMALFIEVWQMYFKRSKNK